MNPIKAAMSQRYAGRYNYELERAAPSLREGMRYVDMQGLRLGPRSAAAQLNCYAANRKERGE